MNEQEKLEILETYKEKKERGVPFFPDIIFKDAVVSLLVFIVLVALAYFAGAPLEARANPADTSYDPHPEWYFLFLFQLLKYFPGQLEVIGVVVVPTIAMLLIVFLPFLDRSSKRNPRNRPIVMGATAFAIAGIAFLTVQSVREAPPPTADVGGDPVAVLYTQNCAGCHGPSVKPPPGTNLHEVIAQGYHEGMPAWNADLTTDEIDALAGFILSPDGNTVFTQNCSECHEAPDLVATSPLELRQALDLGANFPAHSGLEIPEWSDELGAEERSALMNFLVAPDGQRLYTLYCATCHGRAVPFSGSEEELRNVIAEGGMHLEMPPWRERLPAEELDTLARYVVDPSSVPEGEELFGQYCSTCHGERIPPVDNVERAREVIASGGAHQTMPVWGTLLTSEQLAALVTYSLEAARGTPLELGRDLFSSNCANCHGEFGEGGPNPSRQDDVIAPISTSEYLKTRDDSTLRAIIAQGQPNFGMSPFGTVYGGPLEEEEIDAIVAYMRAWEDNPPVELPPEVRMETIALEGRQIFREVCAQCHGEDGSGDVGPALSAPEWQQSQTDQEIFDTINIGHPATGMIAWGEVLTSEQIQQLVDFIRTLEAEPTEPGEPTEPAEPDEQEISFADNVMPIFEAKCIFCHGTDGGWDSSSYEAVMETGDHAPVVIPGNVDDSFLAQKILGTHEDGNIMPPGGKMDDDLIQIILDWIEAGALDN